MDTHTNYSENSLLNFMSLIHMEIHEKIRSIRQARGITQDFLAERLNIDTVNYGRIERGQAKLTVERFEVICELLEVNPGDFFKVKMDNLVANN